MKIEIAIEGPREAIRVLRKKLPCMADSPERGAGNDPRRARLILIHEEKQVNPCLIRLANVVDSELELRGQVEFRVRNLAYSEPTPSCESLMEPFRPVPSLSIQPWCASSASPAEPCTIHLDSNLAFGNGRHPTTEMCLKAIHQLSSGPWGLNRRIVVDFGCGTGLLAIAAVKLGASRAQGVEIDPEAAATAKRNVTLNGLSEKIVITCGSWEAVENPVDLILANLVPSVLIRTGLQIPAHLMRHGRAVVSGFGASRIQETEGFFERLGMQTVERFASGGWGALMLAKKAGPVAIGH